MGTVSVSVSVQQRPLSSGQVLGTWQFRLWKNGLQVAKVQAPGPSYTFSSVAAGTGYRADAARMLTSGGYAESPVSNQEGEFEVPPPPPAPAPEPAPAPPPPPMGDFVGGVSVVVTP